MNNIDFFVSIRCMTYNHAPYIVDAMNGFCMQQTTFPFVAVIVDDASTDGEPEVIKSYLNKHFDMANARQWETDDAVFVEARHKENQNCWFAVVLLKYNFWQAKRDKTPLIAEWVKPVRYIAMCEGDDYWIVPCKLQKQVSFLETHSEYTMCFHRAKILDEMGFNHKWDLNICENRDYSATELVEKWIAPTASLLFRPEINNYPIKGEERFISGDIKLYLRAVETGKVRGDIEAMCIYRVHKDSVSRSEKYYLDRLRKYPDQYICIFDNFPSVNKLIVRNYIFQYSRELLFADNRISNKTKCIGIMLRYCTSLFFNWLYCDYVKKNYISFKYRVKSKLYSILVS